MRTLERIPFSLGNTTKKALVGVALTLALLGAGDIYNGQPAEAQTLGEESDSEYAPDCWHGYYPVWITDKNSDGQPGPRASEFACERLPGCRRVEIIPGSIISAFERAGIMSPPSGAFGTWYSFLGRCQGEPWPEFEDYRGHLDANPWVEENIEWILASPFWHSDEIKDRLETWSPNTWWWKRVYGQDALDTDTSETQPTTETTSESTTDQDATDITDTATEPEASPETETTTDTSEVLIQDGYLNRNKIAIFAGGTAILAVLGIATWRRKKVS